MIQSWQAIAALRAPVDLPDDDQCPTCGAEMDDGECEECERAAPLDFDQ